MPPIFGQTIDTGSYQKMCVGVVRRAKQLEDVAFSVTNMDASCGVVQQRRGLSDIVEPADAFLFLDGNARWFP